MAWIALGASISSAAPEPFSGNGISYPDNPLALLSVTGDCHPDGISTLQYTAFGEVTDGAYPGPWTETGTITIGPQDHASSFPITQQVPRSGSVTDYEATFTVDSPEGQISGTKSFEDANQFDAQAACQDLVNQFVPARGGPPLTGSFYWAVIRGGRSTVTLTRPEGVFTEKIAFADTILQIERYDEFLGHPFIAGGLTTFFFRSFWKPPVPASVSLSPADAVRTTGTTHTVTATAFNAVGVPLPDVPMRFRVEGASGGRAGDCVTGSTGTCDFTFFGPAPYETNFEIQSITAWADVDEDGEQDASELTAGASVTFTAPPDADSDGIRDDIDPNPFLASTAFSDTDGTSGSIVDRAGLDVTIADEPAPDGVRVKVGAGSGRVTLSVCGGFTLKVPAGSEVVVTCGSVTVQVIEGSAEVVLGGGLTVVSVPTGVKAKVSQNPGGSYAVENLGGGTVTATVDGVQTTIAAGQARSLTALDFQGFTSPVDNPDVLNVVNAGQGVPFKWRLVRPDGSPHTTLSAASVSVSTLACSAGSTPDQIEEVASGASGLQNLGNGYYQLNWKSPKTYANSCKAIHLDLGEGVSRSAYFKFPK